jgi:glycosyltransferase involved in cell wall biosynthesis
MKILHITPHMGGGVGTVICGWLKKDKDNEYIVASLDVINAKAGASLYESGIVGMQSMSGRRGQRYLSKLIVEHDIVLVHYWGHPMMAEFLWKPELPLPDCRLVMWHHQNLPVLQEIKDYPDLFIGTSPIQGYDRHVWSTGGVSRFLDVKPSHHRGFNIGYVGWVDYRKLHKDFIPMCHEIKKRIPEAKFIIAGEVKIPIEGLGPEFQFLGHTDDVAGVLAQCDVLGYPLRPDHWGTCEQVLGEAMACGVVPVCIDNPAERLISLFVCKGGGDYVAAVEDLYHHPQALRSYSRICRDRAKDLYSIDKMVKTWDEVFNELMQKPKRSHKWT